MWLSCSKVDVSPEIRLKSYHTRSFLASSWQSAEFSHLIFLFLLHQVICHLGTSQEKKEWPIARWAEFYQLATKAGYSIAFTAGPNEREQLLIKALKQLDENIFSLPSNLDLSLFLAILNQAELLISGDTGPLHFAAGLGKKVIGLFGVEDGVRHYAPIYAKNETIIGKPCTCTGELVHASVCKSLSPCMNSISAEQVFELLKERYPLKES